MTKLEKITIAPGLTFDALIAGGKGAAPVLLLLAGLLVPSWGHWLTHF